MTSRWHLCPVAVSPRFTLMDFYEAVADLDRMGTDRFEVVGVLGEPDDHVAWVIVEHEPALRPGSAV
ncbi:MAG: hypothetical protein KDB21_14425 [Acidimicrobiales bacterium]|nr:hypothetical protein [Acidimicrobiales bacterium]